MAQRMLWLVAGAAVRPLRALSRTTEHVALTRDLSRRIEPTGPDEVGSVAASFNAMLDALQQSMDALDASVHAQRTGTNISRQPQTRRGRVT